jgi:ornithine cyclodeaminase/alanine dehydrogenase-like protein (mu-crystallin family)
VQEALERGRDRRRLLWRGGGRDQLDRGAGRASFAVGGHIFGRMTTIPVLDYDAVLAAVSTSEAIERVRDGFTSFARGEWQMPPKLYLPSPPNGDFRAMPVRGEGLAILKWITSFPGNPRRGLPTVTGILMVSDADTGEPVALLDARAVTALRTGAAAAVATQELAREDARSVGLVGCGLHGAWVGRCMADSEYGPGVCFDPDPDAAGRVAAELGWEVGDLAEALSCDVVCTVTPGHEPVVRAASLAAGRHLNLLGADGPGKAEAEVAAIERVRAAGRLFCDEWGQASHGGELTGAVAAGHVSREDVTELGAVCAGLAPGRGHDDEITLFDSTGLAIQDLAIALGALESLRAGAVKPQTISL